MRLKPRQACLLFGTVALCVLIINILSQQLQFRSQLTDSLEDDSIVRVSQTPDTQQSLHAGQKYQADLAAPDELLVPEYAPNNVFYVFCGQNKFLFNHYLSVRSVVQHIRPDNIIFYYDKEPINFYPYYDTFFQEVKDDCPFFRTIEVNSSNACDSKERPKIEFIFDLLSEWGGWYIHETTMIAWYTVGMRNYSVIDGMDSLTRRGFLMAQRGMPLGERSITELLLDTQFKTLSMNCSDNRTYSAASVDQKPFCISLPYNFFPKDIMTLDNSFGRLSRQIFYNSPEYATAKQNFDELIPNIAHMIWMGGGKMDFLFYLSLLSLIYVAEVDRVYIHGDGAPTGPYWDKIKFHPKLRYVFRRKLGTVYGNAVTDRSHITDVWRVEFMIRYGGIYIDTDSVVVRPLDRETRAYDAVASFDWPPWSRPFPDVINFGVTAGKRNARYWHLFRDTFTWYIDSDWFFNGLKRPYHVWERHPDLLKIDPHLQVSIHRNNTVHSSLFT